MNIYHRSSPAVIVMTNPVLLFWNIVYATVASFPDLLLFLLFFGLILNVNRRTKIRGGLGTRLMLHIPVADLEI